MKTAAAWVDPGKCVKDRSRALGSEEAPRA